jgi:hypothetical protein
MGQLSWCQMGLSFRSPTPHEDAQEPGLGSEQPAHTGPVLPHNET